MRKSFTYPHRPKRNQLLTVFSMVFLLVFLTGINFFLYPGDKNNDRVTIVHPEHLADEDVPNNPAGPDEKSPGNPFSVIEEYLHTENYFNPFCTNQLFLHPIAGASKVHAGYYALISPPPKA